MTITNGGSVPGWSDASRGWPLAVSVRVNCRSSSASPSSWTPATVHPTADTSTWCGLSGSASCIEARSGIRPSSTTWWVPASSETQSTSSTRASAVAGLPSTRTPSGLHCAPVPGSGTAVVAAASTSRRSRSALPWRSMAMRPLDAQVGLHGGGRRRRALRSSSTALSGMSARATRGVATPSAAHTESASSAALAAAPNTRGSSRRASGRSRKRTSSKSALRTSASARFTPGDRR